MDIDLGRLSDDDHKGVIGVFARTLADWWYLDWDVGRRSRHIATGFGVKVNHEFERFFLELFGGPTTKVNARSFSVSKERSDIPSQLVAVIQPIDPTARKFVVELIRAPDGFDETTLLFAIADLDLDVASSISSSEFGIEAPEASRESV